MSESLWTAKQLAEFLDTTPEAIYVRHSKKPESLPPSIKNGTRVYWRESTVLKWLDDLEARQRELQGLSA